MTKTTDLIERLRDESLAHQKAAWADSRGGQENSLSAILADEAATELERLTSENMRLREVLTELADARWLSIEYIQHCARKALAENT